jgi:hypothetical protein
MSAMVQERGVSGGGKLAISLLLITPSAIAWFASSAIVHDADFPASAMWFTYETSLFIGCVGVLVVAALTVSTAVGRQTSRVFVWLMGTMAAGGIFLLWYAVHIYRSPW